MYLEPSELRTGALPELESAPAARGLQTPLLMVAGCALALAVFQKEGTLTPAAIKWLLLATGCILTAFLAGLGRAGFAAKARVAVGPIALICLCVHVAAISWQPVHGPTPSPGALQPIIFLLGAYGVLAGSLLTDRPWLGRWGFPLLLLLVGVVGLLTIRKLAFPGIDVLMFQELSCQALFSGVNPYAIRFQDPYPPASSAMFYGPGVSVDGVLQFGFPYMPLTLLLSIPGYLLGDVRYSHLVAMLASVVLLWRACPTPMGRMSAVLLLTTPVWPLMVYLGWTESYVLLLLAGVVYCQNRRPALMPFVLGLLLASKQYMPALAPLALLLIPRPWTARAVWQVAWKAAAAWAVVSLPLMLWNMPAFMNSAVWLQFRQPYRPDALSFLVWFSPADPARWTWVPFAALMGGMAACLAAAWRGRAVSFPLAAGLCLLLFFATNKQAFANYYYLVIGACWCATALTGGTNAGAKASDE